jgi:hypothetical protein
MLKIKRIQCLERRERLNSSEITAHKNFVHSTCLVNDSQDKIALAKLSATEFLRHLENYRQNFEIRYLAPDSSLHTTRTTGCPS